MDTRHFVWIDSSDDLVASGSGKVFFSKAHDLSEWDSLANPRPWRHPILWWKTRSIRRQLKRSGMSATRFCELMRERGLHA